MRYLKAAVGGTFDHFHDGHKQLLRTSFDAAETVVIGITHPDLSKNKPLAHLIEPYQHRLDNLNKFLHQNQYIQRSHVVELTDPFGPTVTDPEIDALVVSQMTQLGAELVNRQRIDRQLPPLPVIITPMVADEAGEHISSTEIRLGKITRDGKVFNKLFDQDIQFSTRQLDALKLPQGEDFSEKTLAPAADSVLVGDMVTHYFLTHNLNFSYAIVDGKTQRQMVDYDYPNLKKIAGINQPGTINSSIAKQLISAVHTHQPGTIFHVEGEEDLLAFVPVLSEPLGTEVIYGQPKRGMVVITLTEAEKIRLASVIDPKFI
jgi:pantetheine-phosphate adenylyltransferase